MNKKKHMGYNTWCNIKQRCYNQNSRAYQYYGGRGIDMWREWMNDSTMFLEWFDRQSLPNSRWTIDRIDNDKGYYPANCRIVSISVNNQNRRTPINNKSGYKGVYYNAFSGSWRASIRWNNRHYSLGYYDTPKEAGTAYNNFIEKHQTEHIKNEIKALNK